MATIDELIIKFVGDAKPLFQTLDKAESKISTFAKNAGKAIGGIFAIGAVTALGKDLLKSADSAGKFADSVGEDVAQLSKFEGVAKRSGGSAEGLRSSITSLNEKMVDARINGGQNALIFQRLGISVTDASGRVRKGTDVLMSLNKQFQSLSKTEQVGFGKKLGLDEGTIRLIQRTPKDLNDLLKRQEKLGVITADQAKASAELNDLFADFMQIIRMTAMMILTTLMPVIKAITNGLIAVVDFVRKNKEFVLTFFIALGSIILINVIPPLFLMAKAAIAAFAPFLGVGILIAGVAALIALIVDDIMNFLKGNDSLIGGIIKQLEVWYKAFLGFFVKIKTNILKVFNDIKSSIRNFVQPIIDGLIGAFNGIKTQLNNIIQPILKSLEPIFEGFGKLKNIFGGGNKLAFQGSGGSNISNIKGNDNTLNIDNVNITASGDATSIGENIMGGISEGWNNLVGRSNSGRKS